MVDRVNQLKLGDGVIAANLQQLFPHREVVLVPAREILLGGGVVHCIVQHIPHKVDNNI